MGIVEVSGFAFTTFQLSGAAYQWWKVYEEGRPADATPPTWAQFLEMFLKEFVPQTLRDLWRTEFERFSELAHHAPILVPTVRERVRRFIEGLAYDLKICMTQELLTDTLFQQVVEFSRMLERVRDEEKESKEAKRSRSFGGFRGFYSSAMNHFGGFRGFTSEDIVTAPSL
ncbi:uncharacterized protein [Nicotiana tomentosiformis]|uniref:uncharacterized protein n=1 Tax=Nicotiana tomentosiformis TaxID=4098 RepID=UPI00388C93E6